MKTLCDSDILEDLMKNPKNGVVTVPKRSSETEPERDWWLIDRALTIPENTTVVLQNCRIKLSDNCRDNFFRSANCGVGISEVNVIRSVHIKGEGNAVLEGADHPRSTGDSLCQGRRKSCLDGTQREEIAGREGRAGTPLRH